MVNYSNKKYKVFSYATVTQNSTSPTDSPLKKKQCPEEKYDPLNEEDDDDWRNKFNDINGGVSTHVEGVDKTQNLENND